MNDGQAAALSLLQEANFNLLRVRGSHFVFTGELPCQPDPVRIQLDISDWDFRSYPSITLSSRPAALDKFIPHLDVDNRLCYFTPGAVVLDRFNPDVAIAQCLEQATQLLNRIAADPDYCEKDILLEFQPHWVQGQSLPLLTVLMGMVNPDNESTQCYVIEGGDKKVAILTDEIKEAVAIAKAFKAEEPKEANAICWLLKTDQQPAVPATGLPKNIKELFTWLKMWDERLYRRIRTILERRKEYLAYKKIMFAIQSPSGWVAFAHDIDRIKAMGCDRSAKPYSLFLHRSGGERFIYRVNIIEVSPSYIHSRNLTFNDLRDKTITLIGCGAVGGYLSQALVRLGAGSGKNGMLRLIDNDHLSSDNLGRHYLGLPDLFKPKAEALRDELIRQFPLARIESEVRDATPSVSLFKADLLIDATGEESVSEMLNASHVGLLPKASPVLYVRIRGNGECVQSLWVDSLKHGCFRCLLTPPGIDRRERHKVLKDIPVRKFVGCHSFTPYAVSSPMYAASLGIDMVIDWMRTGSPSPRFRTRHIENADVENHVKSQNLTRIKGCLACGHR